MLEIEVRGLESLEKQMVQEIKSMHARQRTMRLQGTARGRILQVMGWLFTAYCVARIVLVSIFFFRFPSLI